jgi:hypothetical protein
MCISIDVSHYTIPSLRYMHPLTFASKGVFSLGSVVHDNLAMQWVCGGDLNSSREVAISPNIVVYGSSLEALHVIEKLILHKVNPGNIVWVYRAKPDMGFNLVSC